MAISDNQDKDKYIPLSTAKAPPLQKEKTWRYHLRLKHAVNNYFKNVYITVPFSQVLTDKLLEEFVSAVDQHKEFYVIGFSLIDY